MSDILIKNACVLAGKDNVFPDGHVHIADGVIASVGHSKDAPDIKSARVIDAKGRYCLPGFINPHMHCYSALARGISVGRMRNFGEVLEGLWWPLDKALTLEDVRVSASVSAVSAIKAGVTTLIDHHASYGAVKGSLKTMSGALAEAGLRASLCYEISDRNGEYLRDEALAESKEWLDTLEGVLKNDPSFLQRGMVGLHASMTLSSETLKLAARLMDEYNVGAHVHCAEGIEDVERTRKEMGLTPVRRLVKAGILREGSIAAHCVHVDGEDKRALADCKAFVIHNPMSNLNNAVGIAPVLDMIKRGIPVAVGTDGMSAGVADDLRLAAVIHKSGAHDAQAGWQEIQDAHFQTAPAVASGQFGCDVGVIKKGAAGDVIIVDDIPPTDVTPENSWGHILFGVLEAPVRTTVVNGRILMEDFELKTLDEFEIAKAAREQARELWK